MKIQDSTKSPFRARMAQKYGVKPRVVFGPTIVGRWAFVDHHGNTKAAMDFVHALRGQQR